MDSCLRERSLSLLRTASWTGIAMVEYLVGREAPPLLMEINGRFWGSLPLPAAVGIDFPWLWLQLVLDGRITPPKSYPVSIYCRNLERDVRWMWANLCANRKDPMLRTVSLWQVAGEIGHLFTGRERFDELTSSDPGPGLFLLSTWIRKLIRKIRCRLLGFRLINGFYVIRAASKLQKAKRIIVVCKGNICRSPFLAGLLKERVKGPALSLPPICSRGFLQHDGTSSPPLAVQAAGQMGVDLSQHHAQSFFGEQSGPKDVFVLFETRHADELRALSRRSRLSIIFWGLLDEQRRKPNTEDPDQTDLPTFHQVYQSIHRATERVLKTMMKRSGRRGISAS
jgi:protein-tyrosine-phosphatase